MTNWSLPAETTHTLYGSRRMSWVNTEPFQEDGKYRPKTNTTEHDDAQRSGNRQSFRKRSLEEDSPAKSSNTQYHG